MIARKVFLLGFAAALLAAFGCSSSDNGSSSPALGCTDSGAALSNSVVLACGGATAATTEQVKVVMGGTASGTTTIRGLNFDVTYDPAKLEFLAAASYTSPLFPNALVAVTLLNGTPGHLVVSIQQEGGFDAVTVPSGQNTVLDLSFQSAAGATFPPTPLAFTNAEATTASSAIGFTSSLALSYQ